MCPASLEAGQVWELLHDDAMEPALLVERIRSSRKAEWAWRCVSLRNLVNFIANEARWDPNEHYNRRGQGLVLVGRRLS